jgi:hypothetical protein
MGVRGAEVVGTVVGNMPWTPAEGAGLTRRLLVVVVVEFEGTVNPVLRGSSSFQVEQLMAVTLLVNELDHP